MAKPGPKPSTTSKRNSNNWKAATLFLRNDHLEPMRDLIHLIKLNRAGGPQDQSEIVAAALGQYLEAEIAKQKLLLHKGL